MFITKYYVTQVTLARWLAAYGESLNTEQSVQNSMFKTQNPDPRHHPLRPGPLRVAYHHKKFSPGKKQVTAIGNRQPVTLG